MNGLGGAPVARPARGDGGGLVQRAGTGESGDMSQQDGQAVPIEITITPDRAFGRAQRWVELRQSVRLLIGTALVALLLIATSLGATVAEAPWWSVFGFVGLAMGVVLLAVVISWPFQQHGRPAPAATHYVLGPDALEWTNDATTVRLALSGVREVRRLRHGYLVSRTDGGTAPLICRTTLTPEQDAILRSYFAALSGKSTITGA